MQATIPKKNRRLHHRLAPGLRPHHRDHFEEFAVWTVRATGCKIGFRVAVLAFCVWASSGPYFRYSAAWERVFFVVTSGVTFLTVFLARNAQIRSSKALHLKLDELIFAVTKADNALIESESLAERELDEMRERTRILASCSHCRPTD
ncbi:MAG: low affinity iron permease family protein [Planctomycetia bacterium]|nr:low affinity iron permease family protein [Planctomycetia bacterium]